MPRRREPHAGPLLASNTIRVRPLGIKDPIMGADGYMAGPTDAGRHRVARYGRHSSVRYQGLVDIPLALTREG
jgi:hypothetical protein